ncbi:MAG: serine/threonine-protein kinase [Myxococcales bacterium]
MIPPTGPPTDTVARLCENTPYRAVRLLGRGGMSEVWVVRHDYLGRQFALKILHARYSSEPRILDRLRLEAQVTAMLDHPNIVPVVDFWVSDDGRPCLLMDLLLGHTLYRELRHRERLPLWEVASIGCQILSALGAAHRHDVIHRDIKPENIFLDEMPGRERLVKVLDFGLARVLRDSVNHTLVPLVERTKTGTLLGSPRYTSPEAKRLEPLDHRSDLYSVGVTLYELIVGGGPFDSFPQPVEPRAPSSIVSGIPQALDQILLKSLRADAAARFQSAEEFESSLRQFVPGHHGRTSRHQ